MFGLHLLVVGTSDANNTIIVVCFSLGARCGEPTITKSTNQHLSHIFATFAKANGVDVSTLQFLLEGNWIEPHLTPEQL